MITSIRGNWLKAEVEHRHYLLKLLLNFYSDYRKGKKTYHYCYSFLRRVHHLILSNDRRDYIKSIVEFEREIKSNSQIPGFEEALKSELKKVINYKKFTDKASGYDAYSLCSKSNTRTCPYCNHSYSFTITRFSRGFRPTLDHFYDKGSYPHLALSLYNLVPACYTCNSSLKHKINFYKSPHLHPLFDEERISFALRSNENQVLSVDELIEKDGDELLIDIDFISDEASNSIETFLVKMRYQSFIEEVLSFARAKRTYDLLKVNTQISIVNLIQEEDAIQFDKNKYGNKILGKLFLDIYNQVDWK